MSFIVIRRYISNDGMIIQLHVCTHAHHFVVTCNVHMYLHVHVGVNYTWLHVHVQCTMYVAIVQNFCLL